MEQTRFTEDGVLQIRRNHSMVNRWNKAVAVGLRHNHDISFIATQSKTMAIVFYVTNYATKIEDPMWKRVAAAAEMLHAMNAPAQEERADEAPATGDNEARQNRTRLFLMRVANRIFTERSLSQVEVIAHLLGCPMEFANNSTWTFLNVSSLYWHICRRWSYLQEANGIGRGDEVDETVLLERSGRKSPMRKRIPTAAESWKSCAYMTMCSLSL